MVYGLWSMGQLNLPWVRIRWGRILNRRARQASHYHASCTPFMYNRQAYLQLPASASFAS
eukprot:scaffold2047_cov50-Tisochrysis_lutea.AAC.2